MHAQIYTLHYIHTHIQIHICSSNISYEFPRRAFSPHITNNLKQCSNVATWKHSGSTSQLVCSKGAKKFNEMVKRALGSSLWCLSFSTSSDLQSVLHAVSFAAIQCFLFCRFAVMERKKLKHLKSCTYSF